MTRRRAALALALVLGTIASLAVPRAAAGHQVDDRQPIITAVEPPLPDVTIQVVTTLAEQLVVENRTPTPLEALAPDGTPFLRIGPDGVHANVAAPAWYQSTTPEAGVIVPPEARAGAPPRWARVAVEPSWGWFDERLHRDPWSVGFRYGVDAVTVRGGHRGSPRGHFAYSVRPQSTASFTAAVLGGRVPAVALERRAAEEILVLGEAGEPLLRLDAAGVEANDASPTWSLTSASRREVPTGPRGPEEPPRWRRVSTSAQLAWLDHRAVGRVGRTVRWAVDLRVAGRPARLEGITSWVADPVADYDDAGLPVLPFGVIGLGVIALAAYWKWGRRPVHGYSYSVTRALQEDGDQ